LHCDFYGSLAAKGETCTDLTAEKFNCGKLKSHETKLSIQQQEQAGETRLQTRSQTTDQTTRLYRLQTIDRPDYGLELEHQTRDQTVPDQTRLDQTRPGSAR
jgi:hypothetical protein